MIYHKNILFDLCTPLSIFAKVREFYKDEPVFLFESVVNSDSNGNYSYITIGAKERVTHKNGVTTFIDSDSNKKVVDSNPLLFLKEYYKNLDKEYFSQKSKELNVGFVDGFIGYIGYDMVAQFEPKLQKFMSELEDDIDVPDLDLVRPKIILAFSHKQSILTLITSSEDCYSEFNSLENLLFEPLKERPIKKSTSFDNGEFIFSKDRFFEMVDASKEMIKSGDIFQIVISNRYKKRIDLDTMSFYRLLRSKNPSPYLFFLDYREFSILGSSPEVMVSLNDSEILLRPIAGTRKRGATKSKDRLLEEDMLSDQKERAEHIMLVDLGRNDVGRVAKSGTVKVTDLMRVEKYSHVMHMVSDVKAIIDDKYDMFDLFMSTFTAGTMSGAPKIRAMELIAEFEKVKRSFYSGSIGYFGFDGNMDSSITIRSALYKDKTIFLQAAAGIVADSQNELEYLEVQNKLGALMSTLNDLEESK
jgi:anthranilate synthase component 1